MNPGKGQWYSLWVHGSMFITRWTPVSYRDHLRHIDKYHAQSMFLVSILKKIGKSIPKSSIRIMINISTQYIFNLAIKNIKIPVLGLTIPWITLTPFSIIWFSTLIYVSRISIRSIKSTFAHVDTSCDFFTITFASTCSTFKTAFNSPLTSILGLNYPVKPHNTQYKPDHNGFRISQNVKVIISKC